MWVSRRAIALVAADTPFIGNYGIRARARQNGVVSV
jgi:hypothetical protein